MAPASDEEPTVTETEPAPKAVVHKYSGEDICLVGFCNKWKTSDKKFQFNRMKVVVDNGDATRHSLTVRLVDGCLSFQLVSSKHQYDLRLFPPAPGPDGFSRLQAKDAGELFAGWGGRSDGHGDNFYVDEQPGSVVKLYVELKHGRGPSDMPENIRKVSEDDRFAKVWYEVVQEDNNALAIQQSPVKQMPKFVMPVGKKGSHMDVEILTDVEGSKQYKDLMFEARGLSQRTFLSRFNMREVKGHTHITMIVTENRTRVLAYMLYKVAKDESTCFVKRDGEDDDDATRMDKRGIFWINQLSVLEPVRDKGLGTALLCWAALCAESSNCSILKTAPLSNAENFYKRLGFTRQFPLELGFLAADMQDQDVRKKFPKNAFRCLGDLQDLKKHLKAWDRAWLAGPQGALNHLSAVDVAKEVNVNREREKTSIYGAPIPVNAAVAHELGLFHNW